MNYTPHEKRIAEVLQEQLGVKARMMPEVSGQYLHISTLDFLVSNEPFAESKNALVRYDLKGIEGASKNAVFNAIHNKKEQATCFVIEITPKTSLNEEEVVEQAQRLFTSKYAAFVDRVIVVKDENILRVFERKK